MEIVSIVGSKTGCVCLLGKELRIVSDRLRESPAEFGRFAVYRRGSAGWSELMSTCCYEVDK